MLKDLAKTLVLDAKSLAELTSSECALMLSEYFEKRSFEIALTTSSLTLRLPQDLEVDRILVGGAELQTNRLRRRGSPVLYREDEIVADATKVERGYPQMEMNFFRR